MIQELQETQTRSLGQEDTLEEEMATQPRILPWNIPWTKSLVGYSPWSHKRVGHDLAIQEEEKEEGLV